MLRLRIGITLFALALVPLLFCSMPHAVQSTRSTAHWRLLCLGLLHL